MGAPTKKKFDPTANIRKVRFKRQTKPIRLVSRKRRNNREYTLIPEPLSLPEFRRRQTGASNKEYVQESYMTTRMYGTLVP